MSLKHGLLGLLHYSDMTGYDLMKTFHDSLAHFWQAQTSQIYRELNKLEDEGCLCSHMEIQTDKPNKRVYSITDAGRAELQNWLAGDMPEDIMPTRSEVLMRLFFSSEKTTEETVRTFQSIIEGQRGQKAQLDSVSSIIEHYGDRAHSNRDVLYWDMTADFGRSYNRMCLEWAERCMKRLEGVES